MKKLMLSTALISALAAPAMVVPAYAQDVFLPAAGEGDVRASEFIGQRLYASEAPADMTESEGAQADWQDIGEVNDVLLSRDGSVDAVLVDIGGFLGIGERQVAVSMDQIKFVSDSATADNQGDYFLVMNATKADLEAAPEYQATGDAAMTGTAPMTDEPAATDTTAATGTDTAATPPADTAADTDATATTETDMTAATGTDDSAATGTDTAATTGADDTAAGTETMTGGDTAATTETAPAAGADGTAVAPDGTMADSGYAEVPAGEFTAEDLNGASVYDATDARVGEISELVLDADGNAQQAVIDVGGFLGIGEKPVALDMSQIKVMRSADSSDLRVYVEQTKEELEAMPDYQKG